MLGSSLVVRALQGGVHSQGWRGLLCSLLQPQHRAYGLISLFSFLANDLSSYSQNSHTTQSSRTPGKDSVGGGALEAH